MLTYVDSMVFETWLGAGRRRLWTKGFLLRSVQIWFDFVDGVKLLRCEAVVLL
jgi:hypothetical protein